MQPYSQQQSNHDFQNPYFRFMYSIKSPETKKRYPDRFKAFLDYVKIPGTTIEERLVNFYGEAKQNPPWLQSSLMGFITNFHNNWNALPWPLPIPAYID